MEGRRRRLWVALGILALFALWANLHGGFIGGLLLIALVAAGWHSTAGVGTQLPWAGVSCLSWA